MKKLKDFVGRHDTFTRPVDATMIEFAENQLDIKFSADYKAWLQNFGVLSYESYEIFGLGVKETAWLNILRSTVELRKEKNDFPTAAVPLMDAGDGQLYLYDNKSKNIIIWSPVVGVLEILNETLEDFLLRQLSS